MKTKYIFASSLLLSLAFTGCQDLDTAPEGDTVTTDQKEEVYIQNPERAEAAINAIYSQFNQRTPNENALGTERHNDIGYPTIMLCTDANGMDVVSDNNGYNWQGNSLTFDDRDYTSYEAQMVWNDLYNIIFSSNNAIASFDPETDNPTFQMYLGRAYATRAFCYFNLAQLYQFTYVGNQDKPCVPLITNENSADAAANGAPRATVQAVYDQIEADLENGINYLKSAEDAGESRPDRRYIDQSVAYGLRARVALTKQEWAAAEEAAQTAISLSDARPATIEEVNHPTFWDVSEPDWMWGVLVEESDPVVSSGIVNWPSHMGSFNYGYAWYSGGKQINRALFNTIPDTDARKGWWLNADTESANLTAAQQALMKGYGFGPYTQVKFAPYNNELETSTNANDIPLMRIEEMYLIMAEAQAMGGNAGTGRATLESFIQTYRDPEYTCTAASATDIQEEIYRQRRIEFWGEGLIWFDIMRLNKGVDRRGAGFPQAASVYNIEPGSAILLWRIPQNEINSNQALTEDDNNPSAPAPTPVQDITE